MAGKGANPLVSYWFQAIENKGLSAFLLGEREPFRKPEAAKAFLRYNYGEGWGADAGGRTIFWDKDVYVVLGLDLRL